MKKLSKILAIVLSIVLCLGLLAATASAASETAEQNGLKLTLSTDEKEYAAGETIRVTLKVENTSERLMKNLAIDYTIPEGLDVVTEGSKTLETLAPGASESIETTYKPTENPPTGDSRPIVLVAVLGLLAAAAMVGLTWNRKSAAMVLAIMMVLGVVAMGTTAAFAAEVKVEVETTVKVDGQKYILKATVKAEAEEATEPTEPENPPVEPTEPTYVKVTEDLEDWTGKYLIVYEAGSKVMNTSLGSATTASGNFVDAEIVDGKIVGEKYTAYEISVTKSTTDGCYYIQLPDGAYFMTGSLGLAIRLGVGPTPSDATLSAAKGISFGTTTLKWGGTTSRYFILHNPRGITIGGATPPEDALLYKLVDGETPSEPVTPAEPTDPTTKTEWVKVTETPASWAGTYLLVNELSKKLLNAADLADRTGISATIADGKIEDDGYKAYAIEIIYVSSSLKGDNYCVKLPNGKYLGESDGYLCESDTATTFTVSADGCLVYSSKQVCYSNKGKEFKFYDATDIDGFSVQSVYLYKLSESEIPSEPVTPPAELDKVIVDFEDGNLDKYNNASWKQEQYTTDWVADAGQMNSRNNMVGVNGTTTKFVNFATNNTARRFTYTLEIPMESVSKVSIDLGNWYNNPADISYKIVLIDAEGNSHYVVGTADNYETYAATAGFVAKEWTLDTPATNIVAIRVVTKGTKEANFQYLYADNLTIEGKKGEAPKAPTSTTVDFEDGNLDKYNNASWKQEQYTTDWVADAGQMNSRNNKVGVDGTTTKFANFATNNTTRRFTYTLPIAMESVNKITVDLGNWYDNPAGINYKIVLIDAAGNSHYVVGDADNYATFPANSGFERVTFEDFGTVANVVAIRFVTNGTKNATFQYLYIDNIVIEQVEAEAENLPTYVKLDKIPQDETVNGKYLIVCDAIGQLLDTTYVSDGNGIPVEPVDGKIVGDYTAYEVTIKLDSVDKMGVAYYTIQLADGRYLTYDYLSGKLGLSTEKVQNVLLQTSGSSFNWNWNGRFKLAWSKDSESFSFVNPGSPPFIPGDPAENVYFYKLEETTVPAEPETPAEPTYTQVTETLEDYSGTYLLVWEEGLELMDTTDLETGKAFGLNVEITAGKIVGDYAKYAITLIKNDDGTYYIKLANGKYLTYTLPIALAESDTPMAFTVTEKGLTCTVTSGTMSMSLAIMYNPNSQAFVLMATGASGAPVVIGMYKLEE